MESQKGYNMLKKDIGKIMDNSKIKECEKIIFYDRNANICKIESLSIENLKRILGMMTRIVNNVLKS